MLRQNRLNVIAPIRCFCDDKTKKETADKEKLDNHPIFRTTRFIKNEFHDVKSFLLHPKTIIGASEEQIKDMRRRADDKEFQTHCDILIIGGGGIGSSIAYWLKKRAGDGLNVVVVEKDPTVSDTRSQNVRSGIVLH